MPWKNIFYACYFTLTGVHGVHVLAGMIPIFLLMAQAIRGKLYPAHMEYVGLYWHFVDLVWIFLFPLLYLIQILMTDDSSPAGANGSSF